MEWVGADVPGGTKLGGRAAASRPSSHLLPLPGCLPASLPTCLPNCMCALPPGCPLQSTCRTTRTPAACTPTWAPVSWRSLSSMPAWACSSASPSELAAQQHKAAGSPQKRYATYTNPLATHATHARRCRRRPPSGGRRGTDKHPNAYSALAHFISISLVLPRPGPPLLLDIALVY